MTKTIFCDQKLYLSIHDNYITINVCRLNGHNTSFDLHNNSAEVEAILLGYDPRSIHRLNRNKPQQHPAKAMNGNNLAPASMRSIVGCDRSMGKYADSKVVAMAKIIIKNMGIDTKIN